MKLDLTLAGDMDEEAILDVLNGNYGFAGAKEPDGFLAQVHQEMLREIDTWIDSGRNPDGSESSRQRTHTLAPRAWDDARAYFEHWAKLQLVLEKPPALPQLNLSPKPNKTWRTLEARARSSLIVAIILLSDLRFRLAKCRYRRCKRPYFLLSRVKPYRNGLFCCAGHNQKEAATKSTNQRRKQADGLLLDCAALVLLRHMGKQSVRVKKEMPAVLNRIISRDDNLKTHPLVKINFVTRHWQEILQRAQELFVIFTQLRAIHSKPNTERT